MNQIKDLAYNQKWEELITVIDAQADTKELDAPQYLLRAYAAFGVDQFFDAYNFANRAFELQDTLAEAAEFLAVLCVLVGNSKESYYYRKLLSMLEKSPDLTEAIPQGFLPDYTDLLSQMIEKPLLKRGNDEEIVRQWERAEHWYQQHIAFNPYDREGYFSIVRLLMTQERYRAASDTLKGARAIFPDDADFASLMGDVLGTLGEFTASRACLEWAMELAPFDEKAHGRKIRAMIKDPVIHFEDCLKECQNWLETHVQEIRGAMNPQPHGPRQKLRVGFFMKGFDRTRIAPALGAVLAWHNNDHFTFIGYGEGDITYPFNRYFKVGLEYWRDILETDAMTLRNMVVADQIDILVDLGGLNSTETLRCFKSRLAPVQVLWSSSNLPGVFDQYDYIISDRCQDVLKAKHIEMNFSSVFSASREILEDNLTRPDQKPAFAVDADFADLNYQSVALWARLLIANPDAVLLLRSHDFFAQENSRKLIDVFGNFGLAHRVDVIEEEDRRMFYAHSDVVVLPSQSATAEYVLDALSARKPVIACRLYDQHLSKALDTLSALGLAKDCIADDLEGYVSLGSQWIQSPEKLKAFSKTAETLLSSHAFFDDKKRMEDIAHLFKKIWDVAGS